MSCYNFMAVLINHRSKMAPKVQEILTNHGCAIKMRLGLHEVSDVCSEEGVILMQVCGEDDQIKTLQSDLNDLPGVKAKTISI